MKRQNLIIAFLFSLGLLVTSVHATTPEETQAIAKEAYIYGFPMMESYNTWYPQAVVKTSPTYVGGFNKFRHYSQLFTPSNQSFINKQVQASKPFFVG